MDNFYDKEYLEDTLAVLLDNINDLEEWSVHNDDKWSNEIQRIKGLVEDLKKYALE